MSGTECHAMWHALNDAVGAVIDARQAMTPETERVRLRTALLELGKAKRMIEKRLIESASEK
jgi:hypothetical protein